MCVGGRTREREHMVCITIKTGKTGLLEDMWEDGFRKRLLRNQ